MSAATFTFEGRRAQGDSAVVMAMVQGGPHTLFESQLYVFHWNWSDPNLRWGQLERSFKVSVLAAAAPSLYNPAWLQLQRPSDLEVEAAVSFLFGKCPGSRVEVCSKLEYANLLISHVRNQFESPVAGKTRSDVHDWYQHSQNQ